MNDMIERFNALDAAFRIRGSLVHMEVLGLIEVAREMAALLTALHEGDALAVGRILRSRPMPADRATPAGAREREPKWITYFGQPAQVNCDRRCSKAWGVMVRPRNQLSSDPDDYETLADDELGEAPADPGTYEGDHGKPLSPNQFPNKWCVRQCERCAITRPGQPDSPLVLPDWSKRRQNQPWKHAPSRGATDQGEGTDV